MHREDIEHQRDQALERLEIVEHQRDRLLAPESTEDRLRAVRDDLTWRIGWAAKNDDGEAAGRFIRLAEAIDDVLRHALREIKA